MRRTRSRRTRSRRKPIRSQTKITLWKVEVKEQDDAENDCGDCVQKEGKVVEV